MKLYFILFSSVVALCNAKHHPLSNEFIESINEKATTWKAGKNFEVEDWDKVRRMASGILPKTSRSMVLVNVNPHDESEEVPDEFDAREQWPKCESIRQIRDQSNCGSCWAFGAVEAMSDRICIHSNQTKQVHISAEDLVACCFATCGMGCSGGYVEGAWEYWRTEGIVTGGLYNSSQGCKDYSLEPCEHHVHGDKPECASLNDFKTPDCVRSCYDKNLNYTRSLTFGQDLYMFTDERQIQLEIYKNGPIEADFIVYDDFPSYKSGVYQSTSGDEIGGHAIKILGWGVEQGTKYWLIANSWDSDWGDNGFFKILRGADHCGIESGAVASLPVL